MGQIREISSCHGKFLGAASEWSNTTCLEKVCETFDCFYFRSVKTKPPKLAGGFTLIELLVVIAIIMILVAMLVPTFDRRPTPAKIVRCMSNLRQIDLACWIYASDHEGGFPMKRLETENISANSQSGQTVAPVFRRLPGEAQNMKIFVCPFDLDRHPAPNLEELTDTNISYFLNCDATTNNAVRSILAGDRFVRVGKQPVPSGLFLLTTNVDVSWTPNQHLNRGNLAFADGHVESSRMNLNSVVRNQPLATNLLAIP
jgi:prepilin-type processing-associated H-X9-DG protein/prepilin-type N-terminal cleavage/methylation domain-containing protein